MGRTKGGLLNLVGLEFVVEAGTTNVQHAGGLGFISTGMAERFDNFGFFSFLSCGFADRRQIFRMVGLDRTTKEISNSNRCSFGCDHSPFKKVFQFPNIPGPGMADQRIQGFWRNRDVLPPVFSRKPAQKNVSPGARCHLAVPVGGGS